MKKKKESSIIEIMFFGVMFIFGFALSFLSAYVTCSDSLIDGDGNITASLPTFNMVVSYEELTKDEINQVNSYINQLDPIYLTERQQEIRFVKNMTPYCDNCAGLNYKDGTLIVVLYRQSELNTKYTLCHELLHSYVYGTSDVEEPIVSDLAQSFRCYLKEVRE